MPEQPKTASEPQLKTPPRRCAPTLPGAGRVGADGETDIRPGESQSAPEAAAAPRKLSDRRPDQYVPTYKPTRSFFRGILTLLGGYESIEVENVPARGGAIIASNHCSMVDPPLMACVLERPLRFFAKVELFRVPIIAPFITGLGAFPVVRGTPDRKAIRQAMDVLENGELLLMFPEGERGPGGGLLQEAEKGLSMIALKTRVPVVPTFISGSDKMLPKGAKFPRRTRLTARFGKPIDPAAYGDRRTGGDQFTADVMAAIAALRDAGATSHTAEK